MAPNTNSDYVREVLQQVIEHTEELMQTGICFCCPSVTPEEGILGQYACTAVDRLNSIMRGEPQNYEAAPEVHPYYFIWKNNTNPKDPTDYSAPF
jgi:hypothetical protein